MKQFSRTLTKFFRKKTENWFFTPVLWAVQNGVTSGTTPTTFSPDKTCTRAEIVTFLRAAFEEA